PGINVRGFSQMLEGVLLRHDGGASCMHPLIAIGMVPVPMGVDHVFHGDGLIFSSATFSFSFDLLMPASTRNFPSLPDKTVMLPLDPISTVRFPRRDFTTRSESARFKYRAPAPV